MPRIEFTKGPLQGRSAALPDTEVNIGRHNACELVLTDPKISAKHALLRQEDGAWWVYDLNSSNGTFVNGDEADAVKLSDGDEIAMGENAFVFQLNNAGDGEPDTLELNATEEVGNVPHTDTTTVRVPEAEQKTEDEEAGTEEAEEEESAAAPTPGPRKTDEPGGADKAVEESDLEEDDVQTIGDLNESYRRMTEQLGRVIVGQHEVMEQVLISVLCRGHALLVGVPGLAKTLLISTLSHVLDLSFSRIQFTPDLMPSDITGTDVLEEDRTTGKRVFRFVKGPVFANMVLADEINRTPPKTQAALLEAMQEHLVTVGEKSYHLPEPFFVLATQNPIEQEGTYPLPEAQLDRFMFNIIVDYPTAEEESQIIKQVTGTYKADLEVTLGAQDVLRLQQVVRRVPAADHVIDFARSIARATRPKEEDATEMIREMVSWGAGPRAGIYLILAAKANAILHGRYHATTEDVVRAAYPVLRHRVLTTFNAEAAGITSDDVIRELISQMKSGPEIDV